MEVIISENEKYPILKIEDKYVYHKQGFEFEMTEIKEQALNGSKGSALLYMYKAESFILFELTRKGLIECFAIKANNLELVKKVLTYKDVNIKTFVEGMEKYYLGIPLDK